MVLGRQGEQLTTQTFCGRGPIGPPRANACAFSSGNLDLTLRMRALDVRAVRVAKTLNPIGPPIGRKRVGKKTYWAQREVSSSKARSEKFERLTLLIISLELRAWGMLPP